MRKAAVITLIFVSSFFYSYNSGEAVSGKSNKTVTDSTGRIVYLPEKINRIGCLYAFSGHTVAMLGRGNDIVAVVRGLKRDKLLTEIYPSILNAAVPNAHESLNIEEIARVKPDIVFVKDNIAKKITETGSLSKIGIPFAVVAYNGMEQQMEAITLIGKIIGREKEAAEYNKYYHRCIEKVKKIVSEIPARKRIRVYHSILEPLKTDGYGSISSEWMDIAGVINVSTAEKDSIIEIDRFVNIEQVILWNPDVIITHEDGAREKIIQNPQWSSINAVKMKKIYKMPNGISRWGHPGSIETPLAILWTVKTIYPEYSSSIDIEKETLFFYKKFFNYSLSNTKLNKILYGKGMRKSKKEQ